MALLTPKLLTFEEIEALEASCRNASDGDSRAVIDAWLKYVNGCNAHLAAGGTLTPEQEDQLYFREEKMLDWASG